MNYQKRLVAWTLIYYTLFILLTLGRSASTIKIRPESCTNALGQRGTCMFVWQCIKQEGVQLGPCVDRFLVGSCCALPPEEENLIPGSSSPGNSSSTHSKPPPAFVKPPNRTTTSTSTTVISTTSTTTTTKVSPTTAKSTTTMRPTTVVVGSTRPVVTLVAQESAPTTAQVLASTTKKPPQGDFSGNLTECGIPGLFPKSKVVGGTHSSFGEWPWQVSVRRSSFFGFASTHRCGGAILNANWIATAAHCVDDLLKSQIRIRVGEFDFSTVAEPAPFQERGVEKKVVHPRYNFFTYEHDLALVKLDAPLQLQPHVKPICLPDRDDNFVGLNATVTGWGRLSEGGTLPSKLQQVQVPIISNDKCQKMFKTAGRQENIPEIFMCAGYEAGGRDSCQGDSGGPLQAKRSSDGRWFLAGIISWGIGCAEANMPGVCTRISKFTPWIRQIIS